MLNRQGNIPCSIFNCVELFCHICPLSSAVCSSVLIGSNLASLLMYMMGRYIHPEGLHSSFDKDLTRFLSQAADGRPKYHMMKWADIRLPKDQGGLGITDSRRTNVALMMHWVWRILRGDGGLWLQLLEAKYLRGEPLLACSRSAGIQF